MEDKLVEEEEEKNNGKDLEPKEPKQMENKAENSIGSDRKSMETKALEKLDEKEVEEVKQTFRVRPENTQVRMGENVYMCCIIDHQQGKAQWTKDGFALGECYGCLCVCERPWRCWVNW